MAHLCQNLPSYSSGGPIWIFSRTWLFARRHLSLSVQESCYQNSAHSLGQPAFKHRPSVTQTSLSFGPAPSLSLILKLGMFPKPTIAQFTPCSLPSVPTGEMGNMMNKNSSLYPCPSKRTVLPRLLSHTIRVFRLILYDENSRR